MSNEEEFNEEQAMAVIRAQKKRSIAIIITFVILMLTTAVLFYKVGGVNVCQSGGGYVFEKACTGFKVLDVCEASNGDLWIYESTNVSLNNTDNVMNETPNANTNLGVTN